MYTNPADIGIVDIHTTPLQDGSDVSSSFIGRKTAHCITKAGKLSGFTINLKNIRILLTHYSLRHYNLSGNALRNWKLEGSNDGGEWNTIKKHSYEYSLKQAGDTFTWKVSTNKYYSYFRLVMTGKNSLNRSCFACSGL
eukprot:523459_1